MPQQLLHHLELGPDTSQQRRVCLPRPVLLRAPRSILIRVLLDRADDLLVVKTLAVRAGLGPAELPDIRALFATVSLLHPRCIFVLLHRRLRSRRIFRHGGRMAGWGRDEMSRVNCFAAARQLSIRTTDVRVHVKGPGDLING